jgi:hypothetical protein
LTWKRISGAITPLTRQCSGTPSAPAMTSAEMIDTSVSVMPSSSRHAICGRTVARV